MLQFSLVMSNVPIPSLDLPIDKGKQNNETFNTFVNNNYHNYVLALTEGFIEEGFFRAGFSVCLSSSNYNIQERLPHMYCRNVSCIICNKTLCGQRISRLLIRSDSKIAIDNMSKTK